MIRVGPAKGKARAKSAGLLQPACPLAGAAQRDAPGS